MYFRTTKFSWPFRIYCLLHPYESSFLFMLFAWTMLLFLSFTRPLLSHFARASSFWYWLHHEYMLLNLLHWCLELPQHSQWWYIVFFSMIKKNHMECFKRINGTSQLLICSYYFCVFPLWFSQLEIFSLSVIIR